MMQGSYAQSADKVPTPAEESPSTMTYVEQLIMMLAEQRGALEALGDHLGPLIDRTEQASIAKAPAVMVPPNCVLGDKLHEVAQEISRATNDIHYLRVRARL